MTKANTQPKEWEETTLGEVVELHKQTITPSNEPERSFALYSIPAFDNEKTPELVRGEEIKSHKNLLTEKSVLFSKLNPSTPRIWKIEKSADNKVSSTEFLSLKPQENVVFDYLYYFLQNPLFVNTVSAYASGTSGSHQRVNAKQVLGEDIILPPQVEQREIAGVLASLDDKIELLRKQNETLETIAKAIFHEWFVEFNFPFDFAQGKPDENGEPYKASGGKMVESELGDIPEMWDVKPLNNVATFLNGLALQKYPPEHENDAIPAIKIRELRRGITDQTGKASKSISEQYVVHTGDLLFSWSGSLEVEIWRYETGVLNQHLFKVFSEEYPQWFLFFWLRHHLPHFRSIAGSKATTMGHIQRHHLKQTKVAVPPQGTLGKMDEVLAPLSEKLKSNYETIGTLAETRDALLPKLMNGKIRV